MPLQIPTGFGLAAWHFTAAQGTPEFVTTCGVDISGAGGDFVKVCNDLMSNYRYSILDQTSNIVTLTKVSLAVGDDGDGVSYESSSAPQVGSDTSDAMPLSMAIIARKVTNLGGRKGRGRMFLPGLLSGGDALPGGQVQTAKQTVVQTRLDSFFDWCQNGDDSVSVDPAPLVLLHNGTVSPTPLEALTVGRLVGWIHGRIW